MAPNWTLQFLSDDGTVFVLQFWALSFDFCINIRNVANVYHVASSSSNAHLWPVAFETFRSTRVDSIQPYRARVPFAILHSTRKRRLSRNVLMEGNRTSWCWWLTLDRNVGRKKKGRQQVFSSTHHGTLASQLCVLQGSTTYSAVETGKLPGSDVSSVVACSTNSATFCFWGSQASCCPTRTMFSTKSL